MYLIIIRYKKWCYKNEPTTSAFILDILAINTDPEYTVCTRTNNKSITRAHCFFHPRLVHTHSHSMSTREQFEVVSSGEY